MNWTELNWYLHRNLPGHPLESLEGQVVEPWACVGDNKSNRFLGLSAWRHLENTERACGLKNECSNTYLGRGLSSSNKRDSK